MGRKVDGTKVQLRDPKTGKIVWVPRTSVQLDSDTSDDVEPSHESTPPASTTAPPSSPTHVDAPAVAPAAARAVAPDDDDDDDDESDDDETDDVAAFLGEPQRRRSSPSRPNVPAAPSAPASSGDDVLDFWSGAEPHVEELSND